MWPLPGRGGLRAGAEVEATKGEAWGAETPAGWSGRRSGRKGCEGRARSGCSAFLLRPRSRGAAPKTPGQQPCPSSLCSPRRMDGRAHLPSGSLYPTPSCFPGGF